LTRTRRPLVGYVLVWTAVLLWSVNATVSKIVLHSAGLSPLRLSEIRASGSAVILLVAVALLRPASLRTNRRELAFLVVFGIFGLALVQFFYFVALSRLNIGIALVIEYVAPILVALYARFFVHEPVRRRLWAAIALSLAGLSLVVDLWSGVTLSTTGVLACLAAAVAYALYIVMADRSLSRGRDAASLLAYGFLFASIFWAVVQPWWSFPTASFGASASLLGRLDQFSAPVWLLLGYVVVLGTVVPFVLIVNALHHISPTRTVIVAMLEPVLAAAVAYVWLGEELTGQQIAGSLLVLGGIVLAQTAREVEPTGAEAESGPR
jgi:drug/metabolite transporter (DMT)-like permease